MNVLIVENEGFVFQCFCDFCFSWLCDYGLFEYCLRVFSVVGCLQIDLVLFLEFRFLVLVYFVGVVVQCVFLE